MTVPGSVPWFSARRDDFWDGWFLGFLGGLAAGLLIAWAASVLT